MEKRFSVIVSAYNIENYIERAINSILEQTYTNYELIIINDASKDSTLEKIKKYEELNKEINLIKNDISNR